jgi:hypothetical protein
VQNKFDVELGRVRHRSHHSVSPSTELGVQKRITCPHVSTDCIATPDDGRSLAGCGSHACVAVADTHTTKTPNMRLLMQVDTQESHKYMVIPRAADDTFVSNFHITIITHCQRRFNNSLFAGTVDCQHLALQFHPYTEHQCTRKPKLSPRGLNPRSRFSPTFSTVPRTPPFSAIAQSRHQHLPDTNVTASIRRHTESIIITSRHF